MSLPFGPALRQPDQRSCGAACVVVARMLGSPDAQPVAGSFGLDVLETHRRLTGIAGVAGRLQVPWPRALGTPPWAVAHALTSITGTSYRSRLARWRRDRVFDLALGATPSRPVALYVGSRTLPRHVVLVTEPVAGAVQCYDPASGRLVTVTREAFVGRTLRLGAWTTPWFVVVPRRSKVSR